MKTIHNLDDAYKCKMGGKRYSSPEILRNHMKEHESEMNKKIQCPFCGSLFAQ